MPYAGGDRIKETCNNPGSSAFVLTGPVVGEGVRAFSSAEDGKYLRYLGKHATAAEAEVGAGLYTHSTRTLTRRHRSYPSEGAGVVTFSSGVVHVASTPSVRDVVPWEAASDPTVNDDVDDGHLAGNEWINTSTDAVFRCVDPAPGAAVWVRIDGSGAGGGTITSVNSDVGPTVILDATEIETASFTPSNYTPADVDIQSHLQGIDAELGALSGGTTFTEIDDPTDYSVTSFKVGLTGAKKNQQRRFTGNQNHLIEFAAANLTDGDFGWLIRGGTGTVTLKYNNITLNGGTSDIGLLSKVKWVVHEGGVLIDGGTNEPVDMAGVIVQQVTMRDVSEATNILGNRSGALTVNYDIGHVATVTLTGNITSLTINGVSTSAGSNWLTFVINHGTGPFTWAHPSGTKWAGGSPPTLSSGASEVSVVTYVWVGTDIYGFLGGIDFS